MKVHLMFADRDVDPQRPLPHNEADLVQDLELDTLLRVMAAGDKFLFEVSKNAVLSSLTDPSSLVYRQQVLTDAMAHPETIRQMYAIAVDAIAGEKKVFGSFFRQRPAQILRRSVEVVQLFIEPLKALRQIAEENADAATSEGLSALFDVLRRELDDEYFQTITNHLKQLRFRNGVLMSAELGTGNTGTRYVLRTPGASKRMWKEWIGLETRSSYSFEIAARDEAGATALGELRDRGIDLVADALAQSADHILSFLTMLRSELGFYVGCLNLHDALAEKGEPVCMPVPVPLGPPEFAFDELYDVCLALRASGVVVGNQADADGKSLIMITGANSGGKSTFLRSVGVAHLMMQCGMFVGAKTFRATACEALFTHFIREEDSGMTSGRLDEELSRMSDVADQIGPHFLVLFNESFASTNEREGSEIARQIIRALLEADVRVIFVTHLFDLANSFWKQHSPDMLFLRAEREEGGRRSFKLAESEPLSTSFGEDLYERLGGLANENRGEAQHSLR